MSADRDDPEIEISVSQGARAYAGDLIVGFGGVTLDPLGAILLLSDSRRRGEEGTYATLAIGENSEYGDWRVSLREIKVESGLDVARISVAAIGQSR
jgi:hypothetical protein